MALKIIGMILLFFALLLSLKATVTVEYNGEVALFVRVLFVRLRLFPKKEKKHPHSMSERKARRIKASLEKKKAKKQAKKEKKKAEKKEKEAIKKQGKKQKRSVSEILDIISLVAALVGTVTKKFFGHLKIKLARIHLTVGTGDAAATAIAYGAITQAVNVLFPLIEDIPTVTLPKAKDISVNADFTAEECEIDLKICFSLRVWHLLHVGFAALITAIKHFFKRQKRLDEQKSTHSS